MESSKGRSSFPLINPGSVLSQFCTAFLEAGWIAAVILSALFVNVYVSRMFEMDKIILVRSIAILMCVAWLIKTIECRALSRRNVGTEQPQEARPKYWWLKYSIFLPAGLYLFSYLISTLTSVLPTTSFWGSYRWRQGLYTTMAYFVIFILAAIHLKSRAQVKRLITAIILTSLPVMVYGLIQKLGWDPISWKMNPTKRIFSTLGNPIFFGAYLIMIVPLTLVRLVSLLKHSNAIIFKRFKVGFYSLILLLQDVSIILTQSRGPLLGLISGLVFFFFIYALLYKKKVLAWGLVSGLILGMTFVIMFNLPNTPLEPLKKMPYLERLGRLNPSEGSARTRIINWENALKLMRETYQPILPHPELIDAHPWRFILGYGPETFGNISFRHYTKEKTEVEGRHVVMDHCHNSLFQTLVTQGIFGLIAFLCLISGAIYLGLRTLKRLTGSTISGGLPFLLLGIISAIVAHFVEGLFGLGVVTTYMHFWLFLALLHAIELLHFNDSVPIQQTARRKPLFSLVFWVYLGTSLVTLIIVAHEYQSSTNIKAWIVGAYLWILLGILLGTISLYFSPGGMPRDKVAGSAFNMVGYLCLIVVAFILIVASNFDPILADGYHKRSLSFYSTSNGIRKNYEQIKNLRRQLLQKKGRIGLSTDEEKQLQLTTEQTQKMLSDMFGLRLDGIAYDQHTLRYAPNERLYLKEMGKNFLRLAVIWRTIKDSGWAVRDFSKDSGWLDMNATGYLSGPPSMEEIMGFTPKEYGKFNQYDFFYCSLTAMHKAYELEPTNYKQRFVLAYVYHQGALMTRYDGKTKESNECFEKAMKYYLETKEASPNHPIANEGIKTLQKQMKMKH